MDRQDELRALAESWRANARSKIRSAAYYPEGSMERQALEHAAICQANCAKEMLDIIDRPRDPRAVGQITCIRQGDEMVVRFSADPAAPVVLIDFLGACGWLVRAGATEKIPREAAGPLLSIFALPAFRRSDQQ